MVHFGDKSLVELANRVLLVMLASALAACVLSALFYDILFWFRGW